MKSTNGTPALLETPPSTTRGRGRVEIAPTEVPAKSAKAGRGKKGSIKEIDASSLMVEPAIMEVVLTGITPLLVHNFGAKAIKQILDKQIGAAKVARPKKNPFEDFKESLYIINEKKLPKTQLTVGQSWPFVADTFGFPASGFKKAMVTACSFVEAIPKTRVRGLVHIHGDLLPIKYSKLVMRQDTVRVGSYNNKVADIRFRGEFHDWSIKLRISYNKNAITPQQIAMLINNAGFSVGVGEWRPEKDGSHGTFAIGK